MERDWIRRRGEIPPAAATTNRTEQVNVQVMAKKARFARLLGRVRRGRKNSPGAWQWFQSNAAV